MDDITQHIQTLESHAQALEKDEASVEEIKQKIQNSNNPVMKELASKLENVSSNQEAKQLIEEHIGQLKSMV